MNKQNTDLVVLSDLHLTSNKLDEYRWEWLNKFKEYITTFVNRGNRSLVICGDLTEKKDAHPEVLVSRLTNTVKELTTVFDSITILSGNHDGIVANKPFFSFLSMIPGVRFINEPTIENTVAYLPHTTNPIKDWKDFELDKCHYIFMHQTVSKAVSSSNFVLSSVLDIYSFDSPNILEVFSGDVHVPQEIGKVTYVGAPYPIYFGDEYNGRFLILENFTGRNFSKKRSESIPSINKLKLKITSVDELRKVKLNKNDQVNIEYIIERSEQHEWAKIRDVIRNIVKNSGALLLALTMVVNKHDRSISSEYTKLKTNNDLSDNDIVKIYADRNKLGSHYYNVALEIIGEANAIS